MFAIDPEALTFRSPLATFHARDVLAPAAAALACGVDPAAVGSRVDPDDLVGAPFERAFDDDGVVGAEVVDVDRFGSVRLAISTEDLDRFGLRQQRLAFDIGPTRIVAPFGVTFSDVPEGDPVALVDSSGWLTLAVRMGSAAERFGIQPGDATRVRSA